MIDIRAFEHVSDGAQSVRDDHAAKSDQATAG